MPRKKRERCTLCGTLLDVGEYTTDPEASLTCPGCGADIPCAAMEILAPEVEQLDLPVSARARIKKKKQALKARV